jgi:hypothetical protein
MDEAVAPVEEENVPGEQNEQLTLPVVAAYEPASHTLQVDPEEAPVAAE